MAEVHKPEQQHRYGCGVYLRALLCLLLQPSRFAGSGNIHPRKKGSTLCRHGSDGQRSKKFHTIENVPNFLPPMDRRVTVPSRRAAIASVSPSLGAAIDCRPLYMSHTALPCSHLPRDRLLSFNYPKSIFLSNTRKNDPHIRVPAAFSGLNGVNRHDLMTINVYLEGGKSAVF